MNSIVLQREERNTLPGSCVCARLILPGKTLEELVDLVRDGLGELTVEDEVSHQPREQSQATEPALSRVREDY